MLAGLAFCEMLSQYPRPAFQGFCRGRRRGSAAVCDPNPPCPFARYRLVFSPSFLHSRSQHFAGPEDYCSLAIMACRAFELIFPQYFDRKGKIEIKESRVLSLRRLRSSRNPEKSKSLKCNLKVTFGVSLEVTPKGSSK